MELFLPFLTSLLITIISTPLTISFAKKFKLVDNPKQRPHPAHIQQRTVPRAGGLPIFLGVFISTLIFISLNKAFIGILLALIILLVIGLLDDALKNFSPYPRLLFQILAAAVVVIAGVGITFITNPFGGILRLDQIDIPISILGTEHHILLIADLLAFFWIVWIMNMINWAKGVDGQMPGIIFIAALTIGFLALKSYFQGDNSQLNIAQLSFITSGAALGFLFFNWHPAKIFPGFSGSTILGFLIATLCILSSAKLATALLVLLVPAIDFIYTFLRRILSGKSPFLGDSEHLHHLLLKRGLTHQQISLFYIFSCAILGAASTALSSQGKTFLALAVGVIIFGTILWLHLFTKEHKFKN